MEDPEDLEDDVEIIDVVECRGCGEFFELEEPVSEEDHDPDMDWCGCHPWCLP